MPERPIEIEGLTVVVIGAFNPAIFHPSWLAGNNLIRNEEAEEAKVEVITGDVSSFTTNWFKIQVVGQRLSLQTTDPTKHLPLRDLAVGMLTVLEHTPIQAFGLNLDRHFRMTDEKEWHDFGHFFVPKKPWKDLVTSPGMRSLVIEGKRDGGRSDLVLVKMEPSMKVTPYGLYVNVHEHFSVSDGGPNEPKPGSAGKFCSVISAVLG